MQKTFISPHWPTRPITVKINMADGYIGFHFQNEGDLEYYTIQIQDWVDDYYKKHKGSDWIEHMEEKVWFTSDIRSYININLSLKDSGKKLQQDEWTEKDEQLNKIL